MVDSAFAELRLHVPAPDPRHKDYDSSDRLLGLLALEDAVKGQQAFTESGGAAATMAQAARLGYTGRHRGAAFPAQQP